VKFRTNNSDRGSFNWRQRAEDGTVMEALEKVRDSITSYLHENQCGAATEDVQICVLRSTEQLAASLFHGADTKQCIGHQCFLNALDSTITMPNVSNAIIWKAGCSLIQQMHLLSELPPSSCRIICTLSFISLHCLQSLTYHRKQLRSGQFNDLKDISNIDACKCLSMLVEILRFDVFNDKLVSTDEVVKCKSSLMSCIAICLSFTINNSGAPPLNKNDVRCSFFPWGAEKMVNIIAKETVLPFIELQLKGMDESTTSMNLNYCHGAMECIYILLRDPKWETTFETIVPVSTAQLSKYATAILAPLIVDILPDGEEKHHANPLRSKILSLICTYWDLSFEYITKRKRSSDQSTHQSVIMLMPCQCMAAALNALSALRKSKNQNQDDSYLLNFSNIAWQLQSMIHNEDLRSYRPKFLSIIALLGLAYPSASANQWHIFLEQSPVNEAALLSIMDKGSAALASEKLEDDCWIALPNALHATSVLLTAMPVTLWISSGEAKTLTRMSGGVFSKRIRTALFEVISCICKLMLVLKEKLSIPTLSESSIEVVMRLVSELAGKFFSFLPFNGDNSILLDTSVRILQCAGDIYVNSVPATKLQAAEHTLWKTAIEIFGSVIIESLGDNESVAKISAPATAWLSSASSFDFIGLLLTDSRWPCPSSSERMLMLSALARSSPATLVREPFNLASFCEVCTVQTQDECGLNSRILGLKLIESFIYGRKNYLIECKTNSAVDVVIRQTFSPLLLTALDDSSAVIRTCAVSSFASLLRRDWSENLDSFADSRPLESILKLCSSKHENVASVRAASCKAIGDIAISCTFHEKDCNDYAESLVDSSVFALACKVCEVMKIAIVDKNASVRSMVRNFYFISHGHHVTFDSFDTQCGKALYAIGNTSLALKEHLTKMAGPIEPPMRDMFLPVCNGLDDSDDKVFCFITPSPFTRILPNPPHF
jgi:hypothetical protein